MPPHPRGGISTRNAVLCTCSECSKETTTLTPSQTPVRGRLVGRVEYKLHRQRFLAQSPPMNSADEHDHLPSQKPPSLGVTVPPAQPNSHQTPEIASKKPHFPRSFVSLELKRMKRYLDTHSVSTISEPSRLIFANPPTPVSPPIQSQTDPHIYALQPDATNNLEVLDHKRWLLAARTTLRRLSKRPAGATRFRLVFLLDEIARKLAAIDLHLQREWERRRHLSGYPEHRVIDTSTYPKAMYSAEH